MTSVRIEAFPETGVRLNGQLIEWRRGTDAFYSALGKPSRIYEGKVRAPVGHRNNHVHVYDELGICLFDHHATFEITAIMCLYDPTFLPANPARKFSGSAFIVDEPVLEQLSHNELSSLGFATQLTSTYDRNGRVCSVHLDLVHSRGMHIPINQPLRVRSLGISLKSKPN